MIDLPMAPGFLIKKAQSLPQKNGLTEIRDVSSATQLPSDRSVVLRPILSNGLPLSVIPVKIEQMRKSQSHHNSKKMLVSKIAESKAR